MSETARVPANGEVEPGRETASTPTSAKLPDGQYADHWVLSEEERAKGFVRPVRRSYVHDTCGAVTRMGPSIAETYARQPFFYGSTFCVRCGNYFPVGADGEFTWDSSTEKVGT